MNWFRPSKDEQQRADEFKADIEERIQSGQYQRDAEAEALKSILDEQNNNQGKDE